MQPSVFKWLSSEHDYMGCSYGGDGTEIQCKSVEKSAVVHMYIYIYIYIYINFAKNINIDPFINDEKNYDMRKLSIWTLVIICVYYTIVN